MIVDYFTVGNVWIVANSIMAVFPYTRQTEILNTAVLSGEIVSVPVELFAAYTSRQVLPYTGDMSCSSSSPSALTVNPPCSNLQLVGSETIGSDMVNVTFVAESQSGVLPLRIYFPQLPLTYTTADMELNRIQYSLGATNCVVYQQTALSISTDFLAGSRMLSDILVSDILIPILAVNDSTVATTAGGIVYGLSPGSVEVCPGTRQNLGCVEISVSEEPVSVAQVIGSLLVELSLEANSTVAAGVADTATIGLRTELQFEQERGNLSVAALYSDGTYSFINASEVTLLPSSDNSVYSVQGGQVVALGTGEAAGVFIWEPLNGRCNLLVTQTFPVSVLLPLPVALRTSLLPPPQAHSITTPSSAAALIGIPTQLTLLVELEYPGGQRLDVTSDSRVTYLPSMDLITIDSSGTITASSQTAGSVLLTVLFSSSGVNLTALVLIQVIQPTALRLQAFPYPSYPGSETNPITTLSLIEDTGVWQRASLQVQLLLSDNTTRDVTSHASTSLASVVVTGLPNPQISSDNILSVFGDGVMDIIVTFGPNTTRDLFRISGTPVRVTGLSVNPLSSNTLRGIVSTFSTQVSVDLTFSDGTQFLSYPVNPAFTSLIPGLVSYSSPARSPAFNVSQDGMLQPLMNTLAPVPVQATAGINSLSGTTSFYVNLDPDSGDVDLGRQTGTPIPRTQLGAELVVPVRVNTSGRNLGSINVMVTYDSSVLAPVSVDLGPGWGTGLNEASLNDPPGEIRFGGALSVDGVVGSLIHIFSLRLRVVSAPSSGQSFLRGTVVTFAERNIDGTTIGPATPHPIVAGDFMFEVQGSMGKRSVTEFDLHSLRQDPLPHNLRERRATGNCPSPPCACSGQSPGDTDGNCVFDIRDVTYTLIYITESLLNFNQPQGQEIQRRITAAQLRQLDPTQDGIINTNDAYFLLRAVFRLVYFLQSVQIIPVQDPGSTCLLTIQVQLQGPDNSSVGQVDVLTDVAFRDSSPQAGFESSIFVRGSLLTSSKGPGLYGGLLLAERTSEDVFIVQLVSNFIVNGVGVSVIVTSFDAQNATGTSRIVQFFGPPPPMYSASLNLNIPVRGTSIQVAALSGYSPLQTFSSTILSSQCSDLPLLAQELNVTFVSPFQADLQWDLLNIRTALDFTTLLQLSLYSCSVDQTGATKLENCTTPALISVQNDTMHSLGVRPFTDYFLQIQGPTTNTSEVEARSPEAAPEGVDLPMYVHFERGVHFTWNLPTYPNGIITHYTLYLDTTVIFNGTSLSYVLELDITQAMNYSLVAHNSAGSTASELGIIVPPTPVTGTLALGLSIVITDIIIICAVLTVAVLIVLLSAMTYGMVRSRRAAKEKPPAFISLNFSTEIDGVVSCEISARSGVLKKSD